MTQPNDYIEQELATECDSCMASWRARWANDPGTHEQRARFAYALGMTHIQQHRRRR